MRSRRIRGARLLRSLSATSIFWNSVSCSVMIVIGTDLVVRYFGDRAGHKGIKGARTQYEAWLSIAMSTTWRNPQDVKAAYPKASILKAGRVVFNIKGNDLRLIARVQYQAGVLAIRFFGTHAEYDAIDAETV